MPMVASSSPKMVLVRNAAVAFINIEDDFDPEIFPGEDDHVIFLHHPHPPSKREWPWNDDENQEDCSSGSEPDRKRAKPRSLSPISFDSPDTSFNSDGSLELPWTSYNFLDLRQHPETVYVDKTRCIPQLPDTFRCILLRPPRFGKTTFLSTLIQYYDIRGEDQFAEHFGALAATTEAAGVASNHSQHLCLSFTLSKIDDLSDITEIATQVTSVVWCELHNFLAKYAAELQFGDPATFFEDSDPQVEPNTIDLFARVFNLVRSRGFTLFVGVDEYDAPIQGRSFMHLQSSGIPESFPRTRDIECLLDSSFWAPLRAGADVIAKLFVTGTHSLSTSLNLTNLRMLDLTDEPRLEHCCGFTEQEALTFAGAFLEKSLVDIIELRRTCGEYIFSSSNPTVGPVLHPQEVILRIAELSRKPLMPYTPKSYPLLPGLFERLPNDSDVFETVSTYGLVDLLASGTVEIDADGDALPDSDGTLTWRALRNLGVLTYDCQGRLRVANNTVLSLIHAHIDPGFFDRHDPEQTLFAARSPLEAGGDADVLLELFTTILRSQTQRAFGSRHFIEPNVHGIFELAIRRSHSTDDSGRGSDPVVLSPPQIIPIVEVKSPCDGEVRRVALKTLTLCGMWRAANPNDDEPSIDALRTLHAELLQESEESLVARLYCDPDTGATAPVESFLQAQPGIPVLLGVGGAHVLMGGSCD